MRMAALILVSSKGSVQNTKYGRRRGSSSTHRAGQVGGRGTLSTLMRWPRKHRKRPSPPRPGRPRLVDVTTWTMGLGAAVLVPVAANERPLGHLQQLDWSAWALIVFLGVLGGALGYFL